MKDKETFMEIMIQTSKSISEMMFIRSIKATRKEMVMWRKALEFYNDEIIQMERECRENEIVEIEETSTEAIMQKHHLTTADGSLRDEGGAIS